MSRGFIVGRNSGKSQEQVMEEYYKNGRMLMSLAGAVGRLVLAGMPYYLIIQSHCHGY